MLETSEEKLSVIKRIYKDNRRVAVTDFWWMIEQAETLRKIANRWVEIETNGTYEEANDFYTFVQDVLSEEQLN